MTAEEKKMELFKISKKILNLKSFEKVDLFPSKKENFLGVLKVTRNSVFDKINYMIVDCKESITNRKSPLMIKSFMGETGVFMKQLSK